VDVQQLGNENFCPRCGLKLQQNKTLADNNQSIGVQHTTGDVMGAGNSGIGNVIAKDTKGKKTRHHSKQP
jgi:hypothetical protein